MDKDKKHVIPRDRYKRRRRVFTEDGQEPIAPYKGTGASDEDTHINDQTAQSSQSAAESRREQIADNSERSHEPVYGYDDLKDDGIEDEADYQDVYTSGSADSGADNEAPKKAPVEEDHMAHGKSQKPNSGIFAGMNQTPDDDQETPAEDRSADGPYKYPGDKTPEEAADRNAPMKRIKRDERGRVIDGDPKSPDNSNQAEDNNFYGAVPPGGSGGNNNGRRKNSGGGGGGFFRSFLLPLLAGILGALLVLLLSDVFNNGDTDEQTATNEETAGTEEEGSEASEEAAGENPSENEITEAIDGSRDSVVSVINLQRVDSMLPGIFGEEAEIQQDEPEEAGIGSGVIYKTEGDISYIVTNHHVVEGAEELQINMQNGESLTAEIVGTDIWTDLAVLSISSELVDGTLDFADSNDLTVGQTAIAIGSPLGEAFSGSVSQGIVSGLDRSVPVDLDGDGSYDWEANVIQTDAAINPGNSGGALINSAGNLIGINSMKISMPQVEGIGFAIPSDEVRQVVTQIEENGEVQRPFLGVTLQDLYTIPPQIIESEMSLPEDVSSGVVVSSVQPGSPAANAGLQQLDLITALDGNSVNNMMELRQYLYYEKQPGDEMTIDYYRNGEQQTVTVNLE